MPQTPTQTPLQIGAQAPAFTLPDQNGTPHSLDRYKGKWVVLYFYPKALTPGCTTQAQTMQENLATFTKKGIVVLGISADEGKKLKKFEEKHGLTFTLLGDTQHTMLEAYGMWQEKSMYGRKYMGVLRSTVLVNPEGKVAHIMHKVSPSTHHADVLKWLEAQHA